MNVALNILLAFLSLNFLSFLTIKCLHMSSSSSSSSTPLRPSEATDGVGDIIRGAIMIGACELLTYLAVSSFMASTLSFSIYTLLSVVAVALALLLLGV